MIAQDEKSGGSQFFYLYYLSNSCSDTTSVNLMVVLEEQLG